MFKLLGKAPALWKKISPSIVDGVKDLGKNLFSAAKAQGKTSGVQFLSDIISGENVLESAKNRLAEAGKAYADTATSQIMDDGSKIVKTVKRKLSNQEGSGAKRRRIMKKKKPYKKKPYKKKPKTKKPVKKTSSRALKVKRTGCGFRKCPKLPYRTIFD